MKTPVLSVCLITYNHAAYIRRAIEGVLMQRVNFTWNLLIADDFSTDGTREIITDYKKNYPDFITLILQEKNVGAAKNWYDLITYPKSKYIAYFEGDDYWTDPNKLQIQVDYLEKEQDYVMCFHNSTIINEVTGETITKFKKKSKTSYDGENLLKQWLMPTSSVVFRNRLEKNLPGFIFNYTHGDLAIFLYLSQFGRIGYIDKIMSVYRINNQSTTIINFKGIEHIESHIKQCNEMLLYFKPRYTKLLKARIADYLLSEAVLYARNGLRKKSLSCLFMAFTTDFLVSLKKNKYIVGTFFYVIKSSCILNR